MGIEPTFSGWKPNVLNNLPLYDTRIKHVALSSFDEVPRPLQDVLHTLRYKGKTTLTNASAVSSDHALKEWSGRSPQADEGLGCFVQ